MLAGLLWRQHSGSDLLLYPRVILRYLGDPSRVDAIGPAITDVGYVHLAAQDRSSYQRSPHALFGGFGLSLGVKLLVGSVERPRQAGGDVVACVAVVVCYDELHGSRTGYLPSLVSSHAIGDQIEGSLFRQLLGIRGDKVLNVILVMGSCPANVS